MTKIFSVSTDALNRKVICNQTTLDDHIIAASGHVEMAKYPQCIPAAIEDPDYLFESSQSPKRDIYFAKGKHIDYPDEYVKVVVDFSNPSVGYVTSAWTQLEVKGGIGRIKYEKDDK